jgi:hypothetical protein
MTVTSVAPKCVEVLSAHPRRGGAVARQPPIPKGNLRNIGFLYTMISKVLRDIRFSLTEPLNSAGDYYIGTVIWPYIRKIYKYVDIFSILVSFNFPCNLTRCGLGGFRMIFITLFLK